MPTATLRGIDTDNYDGPIPQTHFKMLHDDYAVVFNIIGLEARMPFVAAQRDASIAAGVDVPFGYKFLYWVDSDLTRMKEAAEAFGKPIAIDCEIEVPSNWTKAMVIDRIQAAKDLLLGLGLYWGIYTGGWWWPGATGNSKQFKDDLLWHAAYPFGENVLPPESYLPTDFTVNYGGWTKAEVWQYANVCYGDELGPWALDLNAYQGQVVQPPVPVPSVRTFLWGDEAAGMERRGNQQIHWNNFIEIDEYGDPDGLFPGRHRHNEGGNWVDHLP